jgi:hypothetical protein
MSGCDGLCLWCERPFPARRGGSPQRFCTARCRTAFWTAMRRWGERAVSAGVLTVDHIRSSDPAACTLLPGAVSPSAIPRSQDAAPVASADSADEAAAELFHDLLVTLLADLPDVWSDLAAALPEALFDRVDHYLEAWLSEPAGAPMGCDPQ